jgi:hypothetical protein
MSEYSGKDDAIDMEIFYNKKGGEYIPLAKIPDQYGPDYRPRIGIDMPPAIIAPKDSLLQFYIGTVGLLGIIVLYKFFEKS